MKIFSKLFILCFVAVLAGCAIHNTPDTMVSKDTKNPNTISDNHIQAYVDQSGSFYPQNWEARYGTPCKYLCWRKHYSLKAIAKSKNVQSEKYLASEENRILSGVEGELKDVERIFILIHGYNNSAKVSAENYERIKELIDFNESDAVIEFFWDGLISRSWIFGDAKIWFRATGYSQLAGAEGLRDILNSISNKKIFIITHSRGASVAISALSNPPYGQKFADDTLETHGISVYDSMQLEHNENRISLILLAPAIGEIDFKSNRYYQGDESFRELGSQLINISYTVNPNDSTLKKFLDYPNVTGKFNPTNFGYDFDAGAEIRAFYENVTPYDFSDTHSHSFSKYIENEKFLDMLEDQGIRTNR